MLAREERKVVSVLFCDLVDFTSHAERLDPEEVRAIQAPYYGRVRAELERHGGTVEKFIGDAVMALFGAPNAHEDDPERAVRAALAIRDWAAKDGELHVRIAITTGEALVRLEATPLTGEGMASGDVVNTAARLQAAAPEGGVLVDETTYRATQDVVEYWGAKPVAAKGKTEPVAVWEAVRTLAPIRPEREARAPLMGREHELAVLRDAFAGALGERSTRLVTLIGVPGIGKSRLVHELSNAIEREGSSVTWLEGRSLPYGTGVTLWALGEIVKAHASILESDGGTETDEKLRRAVTDTLGEAEDADWVHAHLRPLVARSGDAEPGVDRRAEAFAAWRRFFEALAAQRPLVVVFEDVHWADDTLLDFVEYLAEWATELPLLMLATARPELLDRRPAWGRSEPHAKTLMLAPLSDEETTQLLTALLDRPLLEAETKATLLTQAAGNPLYAEEYVRLLAGGDPDAEVGKAPETVQGIIAARVDGLSVEEKALLQDAAVVGTVFWSGVVGVLAQRDRWAVETDLLALERRDLLGRARESVIKGDTQYGFNHELMRDVAYGEIPHAERADKHLRVADWIESLGRPEDHAELLVHHYVRALEYTPRADTANTNLATRARLALRDAGDRACALNAFVQGIGFYRDALKLWPPDDSERPQLLFRYASALHMTGDQNEEDMLTEARSVLSAVGDIETAAEADMLLAEMWWLRGRRDCVEQHLERALTTARGRADTPAKARVLGAAAKFRMIEADAVEATRLGRETLALTDIFGLPALRADALVTIGTAKWQSGDESGIEDLERAITLALDSNALRTALRGYNNLAIPMGDKGLSYRLELLRQAHELAERLGDQAQVRFLEPQIADGLEEQGSWGEALDIVEKFIAECESGSDHRQEPAARRIRAWIRLGRGDDEGALDDWRRGLALATRQGSYGTATALLAFGAHIHVELGIIADARRLADEVLSRAAEAVAEDGWQLAWVAERLGRVREVRTKFAAAPKGRPPRIEHRMAALVLAGEPIRAAEIAEVSGARSSEALTRLLAGRQLVALGRSGDAHEQLEKALAFSRSVGATRFIREGESLLAMKGART
jgi:class 3 adenylate cyclase/tetratricopeptide (TPR) repeat protein